MLLLNAAGATATQTSAQVHTPRPDGLLLRAKVTAGVTLSLTLAVDIWLDDSAEWIEYCKAAAALTGVSNASYLLTPALGAATPLVATGAAGADMTGSWCLPAPDLWRARMIHGNATAATYTVTATVIGRRG